MTRSRVMAALGQEVPESITRASEVEHARVLISEDSPAPAVLAAVRGLARSGYIPFVAVNGPGTYAARSRFAAGVVRVPDPSVQREDFIKALADQAERLHVSAVLPGTEASLLALAGHQTAFSPECALGAPEPECVSRALDKGGLTELGKRAGLFTPPTMQLRSTELRDLTFSEPIVLKPRRSMAYDQWGNLRHCSAHLIWSESQLTAVLGSESTDEWLVQPFLQGTLETAAGVAWNGEVVAIVHQVADRIHPDPCGTSAYAHTIPRDPAVESGARNLIAVLGWSGIFQIQMVNTFEGRYLIDFNPRPYGSMALAIAAGSNLPTIWADLLLGRSPRTGDYRVGTSFRSEELDLAALITNLLGHRFHLVRDALRTRPKTAHAVFDLSDPLPTLTSFRVLRRVPGLVRLIAQREDNGIDHPKAPRA